jgi:hypothetical protein
MVNNSTNINKRVNGEKMLGKTAGAIIMDNPEKLAT